MTLSQKDLERLEASRAAARARSQAFMASIPQELDARDDHIKADLARDNASLKSKLHKVYRIADEAGQVAAPFVACRRSCSACCRMNVSVTVLDAEQLAAVSGRRMAVVPRPIKHDEAKFSGTPCPFLANDECSVYAVRPFACRAHRSFDIDSYWCQPERSFVGEMSMVELGGAKAAYTAIAAATKFGGFADIRDFFPSAG